MEGISGTLVATLWIGWAGFWLLASLSVKSTTRVETSSSRLSHVLPLVFAGYLISIKKIPFTHVDPRLYGPHPLTGVIAVVGVALGLGFAVWARVHLGRNWSGMVTIKQDHELIRSGPYAIVRHPIYTGLLAAFASMAVSAGTWTGMLALVIVVLALVRKLRIEERFMADQFGEAYEQYRREVPALVPGFPA